MADKILFRAAALERLASPEQLDALMKLADPRTWLGLLGAFVLIACALGWGVLGSVPTKQHASGILIHKAGLADVVGLGAGQIVALEVDAGDYVQRDQLVARLAQPALQSELAALTAERVELSLAFDKSRKLQTQDVQLRAAASAQARSALVSAIEAAKQHGSELRERLAAQERLYEKSLVTRELLHSTRDDLRSSEASLLRMASELQQVDVSQLTAARSNENERRQHETRMQDVERQIQILQQRIEQNSRVTSAYEGRVVELRAMLGDMLEPGQPILSIERSAEEGGLEALLYVDSRQGKRIKPGMRVEISPSMARREHYGVLRGEVRAVDDFPSTRRGMARVLHNDQLVETFLAATQGVPTAVRARLFLDPSAPGGFLWSSRRGAQLTLTSGTHCSAGIITGTQAPLTLVFPSLEVVF